MCSSDLRADRDQRKPSPPTARKSGRKRGSETAILAPSFHQDRGGTDGLIKTDLTLRELAGGSLSQNLNFIYDAFLYVFYDCVFCIRVINILLTMNRVVLMKDSDSV